MEDYYWKIAFKFLFIAWVETLIITMLTLVQIFKKLYASVPNDELHGYKMLHLSCFQAGYVVIPMIMSELVSH